jgi:hypothetical protein
LIALTANARRNATAISKKDHLLLEIHLHATAQGRAPEQDNPGNSPIIQSQPGGSLSSPCQTTRKATRFTVQPAKPASSSDRAAHGTKLQPCNPA